MTDTSPTGLRLGAIQVAGLRIQSPVFLAPMAGVTDAPYRKLCRRYGAGLTTAEMLTSDVRLWDSAKSHYRRVQADEAEPRSVQIVGNEPQQMAAAARQAEQSGAQLIDINLGCPAKKVCRRAAGSALLREPALVESILRAVVSAVSVPVTLKTRTGWCRETRNGPDIARLAEDCGIALIAVHGRTRACRFNGDAEYDTIALIKEQVGIPVIANGDIDSPQKAEQVCLHTRVDGVMIGRAAQGRPWLIGQIAARLQGKDAPAEPAETEVFQLMREHLTDLHAHYGEQRSVGIARKHMSWYLQNHADSVILRRNFNQLTNADAQRRFVTEELAGGWRIPPQAA